METDKGYMFRPPLPPPTLGGGISTRDSYSGGV